MRIAVIGLGSIGMGVCRLALAGGHEVHGYDIATLAAADLPPDLHLDDTPAAATQGSDCILLAVFDDAQVLQALTGSDGVLSVATSDQVAAVLSTVTLDTM